jgi:ABC-type nickel/cobalt efflux system permease component RcnA
MSWLTYLALIVIAAFAGKFAVEGRNAFQIGGFEKFIAFALLIIFGIYALYSYCETEWYKGLIPAEIEVSSAAYINGQSGFREGCGAAVFSLSPQAKSRIASKGLDALVSARQARNHDHSYHTYSMWKNTPYLETADGMTLADRWLTGIGCAGIQSELGANVYKALKEQGSFFATTDEAGLIIIPSIGLSRSAKLF